MHYKKIQEEIEKCQAEIAGRMVTLLKQRERLDAQISEIEKEISGLRQMRLGADVAAGRCDVPSQRAPGLKEHIRKLLSETETPLTAREIRDSCEEVGIMASSSRSLLMSVYTTLKRMHLEVRILKLDGRLAYFPRPSLRASQARH